jgi:hypothetical protein
MADWVTDGVKGLTYPESARVIRWMTITELWWLIPTAG